LELNRLASGLAWLVRRHAAMTVVAILVLTGVFAALATQVETTSGNEGFAPDNPELGASQTLSERFGQTGEDSIQILVKGPDVISGDGLRAVAAVREAVAASAAGPYLADRPERPGVVSFLLPVEQALAAEPPEGGAGPPDDAVDELYEESLAALPPEEAGFATGLLPDGADGTSADAGLVLVFLSTDDLGGGTDSFDRLIDIQDSLATAVREADMPSGYSAESFSFALLFADQDSFATEIARLFASAFAIIVVILGFVYWLRPGLGLSFVGASRRTVADVALTMATIVMAITWMNGWAAILGPGYLDVIGGLTEITQVIPVLLIGLGVDYAIHLTSRYREEVGAGRTVPDGISRAVLTVGIALTLATVTTAVGFLTNVVNPVPALKDFGVVAAIGIVASFVLMMSFVPASRLLLDRRAERLGRLPRAALVTTSERLLPGIMARTAVLAERVPAITLTVALLLGGLGLYGLGQLETRFSTTDFVSSDSPIVATLDEIVERFGGGFGETTQVLLEGDVATPEAHNALVGALEDLAEVGDVSTFGERAQAESVVSLLGQALTPPPGSDAPASPEVAEAAALAGVGDDLRVTEGADVAALYLAVVEALPEAADRVLATGAGRDVELARVGIQTTAGEARAGALRTALDEAFAPVESAGADAVVTSNPIINDVIITALQDSQVSSMVITLLAAMLLLTLTFWVRNRRPLLGVITTLPVVLVVLWTFGMMSATGIPFGPVTATIAALAIGIGIPYSIHITNRYLEDRDACDDPQEAIRTTVRHTGGALAGSAFTTVAGFGILVTSTLTPFRQFGIVTAYAIGFSLLSATLVLPSMLALWDRWHARPSASARHRTPEPVASS
jgi:hypothetical protein